MIELFKSLVFPIIDLISPSVVKRFRGGGLRWPEDGCVGTVFAVLDLIVFAFCTCTVRGSGRSRLLEVDMGVVCVCRDVLV